MSQYKTKKGTELPLIKLKGKDYLQVAHRLVWFEEENPIYDIGTVHLSRDNENAVVQATITVFNEDRQLVRRATATKTENKAGFADFVEKAETGAIGRALALLGYGTQFTADELEEGTRLADAPVKRVKKLAVAQEDF